MEKSEFKKKPIIQSLIFRIILFVESMISSISSVFFSFINSFVEEKKVPPVSNPLLKESAVSLAEKIRNQKVSAEEVVRVFIERAKEVNPIINALVDDRFEEAIKEAKEADDLIRNGSMSVVEIKLKKPLLGVPFTAKEEFSAKGLSWTKGLVCRKGKKGTEDAAIVQGLKNSGAILIGLTNIPEFCSWVESRNFVYGQTNNPYKTNRTAGGSSGGEGSLVSSCGSAFGLGSDLGGSIRIPASYCGLYGHKLSNGLINQRGMLYRVENSSEFTLLTSGTLTRYAADLKPSSTAIVQPEKLSLLQLDAKVDARKLKYHYILDPKIKRLTQVDRQIRDGMKKLVGLLAESNDSGFAPEEVNIPSLKRAAALFMYWTSKEKIDLRHLLTDNQGSVNLLTEFTKKIFGKSNHTLASLLMILNTEISSQSSDSWGQNETKQLKEQIMKYLDDGGILLIPGSPTTAPYHYQPYTRLYDFAYFGIFNVLQLPVTQVPIGIANDGLPFGIQVVAAQYQDRLCFAVAEYIESLLGGWVPPFSS